MELRNRYKDMKKIGKNIYEENKEVNIHSKIVINQVGRNDICSCGSGKKYKKYCGKN